jgi:hypothetical protein
MDDQLKSDRVEGEILAHEKEMIRLAMLRKLVTAPLMDKIKYLKDHTEGKTDEWKPEEMLKELQKTGLGNEVTLEQVKEEMQRLM